MTPTRPTELHQRRLRLTREPSAAAEARSQVRAVIRAWKVPVDPDIAVLLTSDLMTSAITHGEGETVTVWVWGSATIGNSVSGNSRQCGNIPTLVNGLSRSFSHQH